MGISKVKKLYLPSLRYVGNSFCYQNDDLEELTLENVELIDFHFLYYNRRIKRLILPKLREIEFGFCDSAKDLEVFYAPSLEEYFKESHAKHLIKEGYTRVRIM